jgi:cytochrome P450
MMSKPSLDVGPVDALALADPPLHTRQRKIALGGLTPKLFVGLEQEIRNITIDLLENI